MPAKAPYVSLVMNVEDLVTPYVNAVHERAEKIIPSSFSTYPWNALSGLFIGGLFWQLLSQPLPQFIGYLAFTMLFTSIWLKHAGVIVTRNHILRKHYCKKHEDSANRSGRNEGPCGVPWCCC